MFTRVEYRAAIQNLFLDSLSFKKKKSIWFTYCMSHDLLAFDCVFEMVYPSIAAPPLSNCFYFDSKVTANGMTKLTGGLEDVAESAENSDGGGFVRTIFNRFDNDRVRILFTINQSMNQPSNHYPLWLLPSQHTPSIAHSIALLHIFICH